MKARCRGTSSVCEGARTGWSRRLASMRKGTRPDLPGLHRPLCEEREMFERFTDRARRVVVLAQEEARMLNHN